MDLFENWSFWPSPRFGLHVHRGLRRAGFIVNIFVYRLSIGNSPRVFRSNGSLWFRERF